jgi:mono/diheme cytochrome c family protein
LDIGVDAQYPIPNIQYLISKGNLVFYRSLALTLILLVLAACGGQMSDQPRYEPLEPSRFFADGKASRDLVAGTVARGQLRADAHFYEGTVEGGPADTFPFPVTIEVLERGQERYQIFCAPCHGLTGSGDGPIVQRGFTPPNSFHIERLREAPPGYYFNVITNGFGAMYSYAYRVPPADRWAIIAYVRALQFSQHAPLDTLPAEDQEQVRRLGVEVSTHD